MPVFFMIFCRIVVIWILCTRKHDVVMPYLFVKYIKWSLLKKKAIYDVI